MSKDKVEINSAIIDWGCSGEFKFTVGIGATKAERAIANYAAIVAPVLLYLFSWHELKWTVIQLIVASLLTLDMIGGVLTNSLSSMKRFLHINRKIKVNWLGRLVSNKFLFPLIHFQLFIIPLVFDVEWYYAYFWYGAMITSIFIIHYIPLYIQRPIALLIIMLSIIAATMTASPLGLEWLAPIFMIKLVLSHGVREEPYCPVE